jgi:hypothetical protein
LREKELQTEAIANELGVQKVESARHKMAREELRIDMVE